MEIIRKKEASSEPRVFQVPLTVWQRWSKIVPKINSALEDRRELKEKLVYSKHILVQEYNGEQYVCYHTYGEQGLIRYLGVNLHESEWRALLPHVQNINKHFVNHTQNKRKYERKDATPGEMCYMYGWEWISKNDKDKVLCKNTEWFYTELCSWTNAQKELDVMLKTQYHRKADIEVKIKEEFMPALDPYILTKECLDFLILKELFENEEYRELPSASGSSSSSDIPNENLRKKRKTRGNSGNSNSPPQTQPEIEYTKPKHPFGNSEQLRSKVEQCIQKIDAKCISKMIDSSRYLMGCCAIWSFIFSKAILEYNSSYCIRDRISSKLQNNDSEVSPLESLMKASYNNIKPTTFP